MKHIRKKIEPPVFIVDSTLGKLAKWLRLAGIDARLDTATPDSIRLQSISESEHRLVLTRTRAVAQKMEPSHCLFIRFNDAMDQARQVVRHFRIQQHQLCLLSRCSSCNGTLYRKSKEEIRGRVPDHILQSHDWFMACRECGRIYWSGTHASRIKSVIEGWFTPT